MSCALLPSEPSVVPTQHQQIQPSLFSQPNHDLQNPLNMNGRKRKADDDLLDQSREQMSLSPSPSLQARPRSQSPQTQMSSLRSIKKPRISTSGRPLALSRLLETLGVDEMRSLLRSICDRNPALATEIVNTAPRPSVSSAISVLRNYQTLLKESFPYGDRPTSEYAFNRVKPSLTDLLDALNDFTPHFLPPNESQAATSFAYLDAATNIVHQLPSWDDYQHARFKLDAYEEMTKSWSLVIREAAKKGSGITIQYGGWDQKLIRHNDISGGKLQEAVNQLRTVIGWIGNANVPTTGADVSEQQSEISIRQQLLNGTYGINNPVQVGPW